MQVLIAILITIAVVKKVEVILWLNPSLLNDYNDRVPKKGGNKKENKLKK